MLFHCCMRKNDDEENIMEDHDGYELRKEYIMVLV